MTGVPKEMKGKERKDKISEGNERKRNEMSGCQKEMKGFPK